MVGKFEYVFKGMPGDTFARVMMDFGSQKKGPNNSRYGDMSGAKCGGTMRYYSNLPSCWISISVMGLYCETNPKNN